jgi:hypothetical protein
MPFFLTKKGDIKFTLQRQDVSFVRDSQNRTVNRDNYKISKNLVVATVEAARALRGCLTANEIGNYLPTMP